MSDSKEYQHGLDKQIEALRTRWPQAHFALPESGSRYDFHGIFLPGFTLCKGWNKTICTVFWLTRINGEHIGSPVNGFYVDLPDLRLDCGMKPIYSRPFALNDYGEFWHELTKRYWSTKEEIPGFPQWRELTRFWWRQQMFNPNYETLYTSAMVIRHRLNAAR